MKRSLFFLVVLFVLGPSWGRAQSAAVVETSSSADSISVVMLPLANHTGRIKAVEMAERLICAFLDSVGVDCIDPQAIRPVLREHRIRAVGRIDRRGASILRQTTGARWFLIGSVDAFREAQPLEFGFSVRLVDARDLLVDAAASGGSSGHDLEGLFGTGRRRDIAMVARRAVDEVLTELWEGGRWKTSPAVAAPPRARCCIIPFDGSSRSWRDGDAVSGMMLSALLKAGYPCLEPGVVRETLLRRSKVFKGEIDLPSLEILTREDSIAYVITGTVEVYDGARGDSPASIPHVSVYARLLDAPTGRILDSWYDERTGRKGQTLFQRGRTYSLVDLMMDSLQRFVERIEKASADGEKHS